VARLPRDVTPPKGSLTINRNAAYTASKWVILNLSATDAGGMTAYYVSTASTRPTLVTSGWVSVASMSNFTRKTAYTLSSGDGTKTVYAWYHDAAGNISAAASHSIVLDQTAPTTTSDAPAGWVGTDQTLTVTASDGSGSGVARTRYCIDTTNSCTPAIDGTSVTVTCAAGVTCQTYVRYRSTDQVENVEATQSAPVWIDKTTPSGAGSWRPDPSSPILTFDTSLLDGFPNDPAVIKDGNTYVMYYAAVKGDFSDTNFVRIFRATSNDGIDWVRDSIPRLSPGSEGSWDSAKVERPSMIKLPDGTYRLYYAGNNVPDVESGFQIGLATSPDGIAWSTNTGNPVLTPGEPGSFDELSIGGARVLLKDGEYWMWYAGMSGAEKMSIGLAKSQDGIVWEKKGKVLALDVEGEESNEVGVADAHVTWNGTEFEMFYAVLQDYGQLLGPIWHATSPDGIGWIKDGSPILRRGDETSWTGQGIGSPSVLLEGDTYRMWYSGTHTDGATFFAIGIGVAEKMR
jgi:predicted GH43/DUF377 family glycosyl hydrolase